MQRYFNIFLLHFQFAFEYRGKSFVFFLLSFLNPLVLLTFWIAAYNSSIQKPAVWELSSVTSYYLLLIIASAMLTSHIEYDVAVNEIQNGGLARYLLRPFSYFWDHLFSEIGWRALQGFFGIIAFVVIAFFFTTFITIVSSPSTLFFAMVIAILAYFLSYLFKMILAFSAFWITDFRGLQEISSIMILIFGGFLMPIEFYPDFLKTICNILPFSYSTYYPIRAFQGELNFSQLLEVIAIQCLWIGILGIIYKLMWFKGSYKFTGIGQ